MRLLRLLLVGTLIALASHQAKAVCTAAECASKINGYAVQQAIAEKASKINGYAVLQTPFTENASKLNGYAVIQGLEIASKINGFAVLQQGEFASKLNAYAVLTGTAGGLPGSLMLLDAGAQ